jgi:hypothetical protein
LIGYDALAAKGVQPFRRTSPLLPPSLAGAPISNGSQLGMAQHLRVVSNDGESCMGDG